MSRELLKLAFEAIERGVKDGYWNKDTVDVSTRIQKYLAEQAAQPQQEPVAWVEGEEIYWHTAPDLNDWIRQNGQPLYTSPPTLSLAQPGREALEAAHTRLQKKYGELEGKVRRTWVELTDEEVSKMPAWIYSPDQDGMTAEEGLEVFARAIEAKLKEKNA